jgi:EAL domain-containing protein (putative c-di-GMP-specific phosphodiesterase class I)/AmiR/NasT family two-component response regulator
MTQSGTAGARVLLVEDEDLVREPVGRYLRSHGYLVIEARDGREALAEIGKGAFDVVLSDVAMPAMGGIALLRGIREKDLDLPVILFTGQPSVETAVSAVELGAFAYLTKPVQLAKVGETIGRAVPLGKMARAKRAAIMDIGPVAHTAGDRAGLEATLDRCFTTMWIAFQPILTRDGALMGYEALMRSREPALPHPGAVLDAAEKLGRIAPLGRALRRLIADATTETKETIFVNLHANDVFEDDLLDKTTGLGRIADRVILEITERAALGELTAVRERAHMLRAMGYRLAIDDLGAGYAGLSSFTTLEPEVCKLDMSLVRDVDSLPKRRRLVESMTSLCRDLEITVVAEGVETVKELECLRQSGCDLFQGYLLAKPGPPFPVPSWPLS